MAEYTGSAVDIWFNDTQLDTQYRRLITDETMDVVDGSAGGDANRIYYTTLKDGTGSLELVDQTDGTAATAAENLLAVGTEATLEWAPEGSAAGNKRVYVNAIVTNLNKEHPYDDLVMLSADFQFSGAVTKGTYA